MPYNVAPGAILQATVVQRMFDQTILNIYCYKFEDGASVDGLQLISAFDGVFNSIDGVIGGHAQAQCADLFYTDVLYQWIHPTRFAYLRLPPFADAGSVAGDALPQNVAAAIVRRTEMAGAEEHGVMHIAGMTTDDVLAGLLTTGALNKLNLLADRMKEVITVLAVGMEPVLFNRELPGSSRLISFADVKNTSRVIRRRTVGQGI